MKHLSEKALGDLWAAQRKYHGNEPFKVGHLEFVRAAIAADRALNGASEATSVSLEEYRAIEQAHGIKGQS